MGIDTIILLDLGQGEAAHTFVLIVKVQKLAISYL
jgi:hypothetical protein